jgi:hypothetical protein
MAFQGRFNDALEIVRSGWLSKHDDNDLELMLEVLRRYDSAYPGHENKSAIQAIENEKARRQKERHHQAEKSLTEQAVLKGESAHKETMSELDALKILVGRLEKARPIDWAILIVGAIAAIGTVVAVLIEIFRKP